MPIGSLDVPMRNVEHPSHDRSVYRGPRRLWTAEAPRARRGLGKLMAEFRKASADFKGAFEEEMREMGARPFRRNVRRLRRLPLLPPRRPSRPSLQPPRLGACGHGNRQSFRRWRNPWRTPQTHTSGTDSETASVADSHDQSHDTRQSA